MALETQYRNEQYTCTCGQLRWKRETPEDTAFHEKRYHGYCGSCGQAPCLVVQRKACCHDAVTYGQCSKHAEEA